MSAARLSHAMTYHVQVVPTELQETALNRLSRTYSFT